jgi:hypothetical protein
MNSTILFLAVLLGVFNCILIAVVIFILKQPNPNKGRELAELQDLQERMTELSKAIISFEKKIEKNIVEAKTENIGKLERVTKDLERQLQDIHDNL